MDEELICFHDEKSQDLTRGGTRLKTNWKLDKKWSDKFLPEIKSILGLYLIGEAEKEDDCYRNTDLIVLKMEAVRISCRIRRYEYLKYKDEFTIRSKRDSGKETELSKIIQGFGDFFFYGFANSEETKIEKWTIINLNRFRLYYVRSLFSGGGFGETKKNHDASSDFLVFRYDKFPSDLIFAKGDNIEKN